MAVAASKSRVVEADKSTTDGVVIDEDTTHDVPTTEGAGSGEQNPSAC